MTEYLVSYSHPGGFGFLTVSREKPFSVGGDIMELVDFIATRHSFDPKGIVVLNIIRFPI
jgi:hypothetical protein